ncbi:hypothetical protein [Pseudomonas fluorescens]|uniref:Uncharacterized protein n=1 Tax=Pseudomonas fluorescens TaxID=294 RepID=A0A944HGD1_PSEFL|nr:hypothetical protein [Pseudomonas fluorescens]MBT2295661.1 hypothetical protein [Pseudomonas fluorescens]MBT2310439.1 hypothetical protein [Pseudomonas fluorescens]MBT2313947.1 hypothetical protein [Pseudomonas fluorescens]MBT2318663.1 hypothetical protein [Pseudomonas fluorescens]MBT2329559.1 hypothetical protein [Pseudomonas fluorescens]
MNAKQEIAEIDRERVRSARATSGPLAGLPPEFPDVIISDTDRRVYVDKLPPGGNLPVTLKLWVNQHPTDEVVVNIAQSATNPAWVEVDRFPAGTDISQRPPEYVASIPADSLTDYNPAGTPSIWLVMYEAGPVPGNPWESTPSPIEIDRRAHYQPTPGGAKNPPPIPLASPAIPAGDFINDAYVNSLPNGVMEVTAGVDHWAQGDKCYLYISKLYSEATTDEPLNPPPYTLPQNGKFEITGTVLRSLPSGSAYLFYQHVDAVGNRSKLSTPKGVKIAFAPAPVLDDPVVPLASTQTDRTIDLKDCAEPGGVTVEVNRVDHIEDSDEIKLEWNTTAVDTKAFGTLTKLVFPVPFSTIFDDYYTGGPTTEGEIPVNVKATLLRGTDEIDVASVDIFSNLYVAGPTDPTDPGQPNDQLNEPNVKSTDVDNVIAIGDYGKNQIITIDLWTDVNKPVKGGQEIRAEYAGVRLSDVAFLNDNDTVATISLPWDVINGGGLGGKSLQYFVSDIGGANENPSLIQTVTNHAMVVEMDPPTITRRYPDRILCGDLDKDASHVAVVTIPGNPTHLKLGRQVTLHAQGYRDENYTQTAPGTDFTSTTPHTIVGDEPDNGFEMIIEPYDPFIRNIPVPPPIPIVDGDYVGYWRIWYTVDIGGTPYPSNDFDILISLVNVMGEYCEDQ